MWPFKKKPEPVSSKTHMLRAIMAANAHKAEEHANAMRVEAFTHANVIEAECKAAAANLKSTLQYTVRSVVPDFTRKHVLDELYQRGFDARRHEYYTEVIEVFW